MVRINCVSGEYVISRSEAEVLISIEKGNTTYQSIASDSYFSIGTIQTHLHSLRKKFRVHTTMDILLKAVELGFIHIEVSPIYRSISLTRRECETLTLLIKGISSRADLGFHLGVQPTTASTYLEGIYDFLGVNNRTAACFEALKLGYKGEV